MLKKEELQSLIEREGVMDFIWTRSYEDIPNTEIGLYHLANDRWGCVFKIWYSSFNNKEKDSPETEKSLTVIKLLSSKKFIYFIFMRKAYFNRVDSFVSRETF